MKERTIAEWGHEVLRLKPLQRDDELLQLVKEWFTGHPLSAESKKRLADAGYIYEGVLELPWKATPCCEAFIGERDPEFLRQLREQAQREKRKGRCIEGAEGALRLGLLRHDRDGGFLMTRRGRAVDGIQLLHALIDPSMPFVTLAVHFHMGMGCYEAELMDERLHDGKEQWVRMRKRILTSLTNEERMLVGLRPAEKPSASEKKVKVVGIPGTSDEVELEKTVKDLILETARRLKGEQQCPPNARPTASVAGMQRFGASFLQDVTSGPS